MPVHVRYDPADATAYVMLAGSVRWKYVASALLGLHGPDDTNPNLTVLWDARCVSDFDLLLKKAPRAVALFEWLQGPHDGGRSAVVVRREADAAFVRFLIRCRRHTGRAYGVFTRLDEALAFLAAPASAATTEPLEALTKLTLEDWGFVDLPLEELPRLRPRAA